MTTTTKPGSHAIAGHPAPKRLATPTDLKPAEAQAIVEAINPLVAGNFALYVKTKNYHWHLSGPHFRDYHLLFDEQAEQIFDAIDVMAERVRRIGGTTIRSLSHIQKLSPVHDDNDDEVRRTRCCAACSTITRPSRARCGTPSRSATTTVTW